MASGAEVTLGVSWEDGGGNGTKDILVLPPVKVGIPLVIRLVVTGESETGCGKF